MYYNDSQTLQTNRSILKSSLKNIYIYINFVISTNVNRKTVNNGPSKIKLFWGKRDKLMNTYPRNVIYLFIINTFTNEVNVCFMMLATHDFSSLSSLYCMRIGSCEFCMVFMSTFVSVRAKSLITTSIASDVWCFLGSFYDQ